MTLNKKNMKNAIKTIILALLLFSGCVNSTEQNTQQNEVICKIHHLNCNKLAKELNMSLDEYHREYQVKDESICKIHNLDCNKSAKELNMSLDEYHKWQEEQEKAAHDEDTATDENGDIVGPEDEDDGRFVHIENDDDVINKIRAEKNTSEYSNNTTIKETVTRQEKSKNHVYVCDDCGKVQVNGSSPYDNSTCPETRWGGIGGAGNIFDGGDHNYSDLGNSGSGQYVCSNCHISIMLYEKPTFSGTCGASGSNCCSHRWE